MFLDKSQIIEALNNLESVHPFYGVTFLACKAADLPVEREVQFGISKEEEQLLEKYYKPDKNTVYYYRVFRISEKKKYWLNPDYPSSGSQAIRTQTFKDAFIHTNPKSWGWQKDYVQVLKFHLYQGRPIPGFHLAVWLYRDRDWPSDVEAQDIVDTFFDEFNITDKEKRELFDSSLPAMLDSMSLFQDDLVLWKDLREILSLPLPPDASPDTGGILSLLELHGVGPAKKLHIELSERVNLITGDNGLGKSFILESAWWALSGTWTSSPAYPREDAQKHEPAITFHISGVSGIPETNTAHYDWKQQYWLSSEGRSTIPGLVIYARVDGAFAVWDPARNHLPAANLESTSSLVFTRENVWDGLLVTIGGKTRYLCNGLINDWVNWQNNPTMSPFPTLERVLSRLSPPDLSHGDLGILKPGKPARIPDESRLIPTIKHPYGEIPLIYASAAVRRIVAMAYLIVWIWEEHKAQSKLMRERPQRKLVILIDEIEAHLHPQWQRVILPALLEVIDDLEAELQVQFLVTTHSPLVMASIEPQFDVDRDKIFHLDLVQRGLFDGEVILEEPNFVRYGSANSWLRSEIFNLHHPYSPEAEKAMEDAKKLQMKKEVTQEEVRKVSECLVTYLPAHDKFWPRWTFFAEQHGVEL